MFKSTTIRKQPKQASKLNDPDHDTRTKSSKSPRIPSAEPPRKKARSSRVLIDDAQSSASNDADGAGDDPGAASSASDIPAKVTNLRPLETPSGEESIEAERMESSKTKRKRANDKQSRQSTGKPSVIALAKKPKKSDDLSPGEEKVKRLQSQLLKCGIRKLWHKELAKYKTTQAKVSHLETMLADLGIQGRFSEAQAKKIKAKRELQADIQEIQAGAERWGKQDDGDTARASRPGRGLARRSTGTKVEDDEDEGADSE